MIAWDRIGSEFDGSLASVGLDWEPIPVAIKTEINGKRMTDGDWKLLKNSKTGETIAPASSSWFPLSNRAFLSRCKDAVDLLGGKIERGGYLNGSPCTLQLGDRCAYFVSNNLPELGFALFNDAVDEQYQSRVIFFNHHAPGNGIGCKVIVVRKICKNGLVRLGISQGLKTNHTQSGLAKFKQSGKLLEKQVIEVAKWQAELEELAKVSVTPSDRWDFFTKTFGKKDQEDQPMQVQVLEAIADGSAASLLTDRGIDLRLTDYTNNTAYGIAQSITAYYTHFKESSLRSAIFQDNVKTVDAAFCSLNRAFLPKSKQSQNQSVSLS